MSRLRTEEGTPTVVTDDAVVLGPIVLDLKPNQPARFTFYSTSGKATFTVLGSIIETEYPGGGDWSVIDEVGVSTNEGVGRTVTEYPTIVILARATSRGQSATVIANAAHLQGATVNDFDPLAIAGGLIADKRVENVLFNNRDLRVSSGWEDAWLPGGERIIHDTPAQVEVRSYHADDDAAGPGAQIAVIEGIVDNAGTYELATEAVPLVGNGTATSAQAFVLLHRATLRCGANGMNSDNVEFFHGSNTDLQLVVSKEDGNISHASHFMVPDGFRAYIKNLSLFGGRDREVESEFMVRLPSLGDTWVSSHPIIIYNGHMIQENITIAPFEPRSIMKVRARNLSGGKARISGRYTIILEEIE